MILDRTTAIGLFNYANSYWKSAIELQKLNIPNITHPNAPVDFLYVHAIELFLKSYLRFSKTVQELNGVGHRFEDLKQNCTDLFLDADSKFIETIGLIAQHRINMNSRYIYTGARNSYPETVRFEELCTFLYESIKQKMITAAFQSDSYSFFWLLQASARETL